MKCRECDKMVKQLSYLHLKYCCGLTPQQYKTKHNVTTLQDEDVKERSARRGPANGRWIDGRRFYPKHCECGKQKHRRADKCSECVDFSGVNNPFYGKTHSLKTLRKINKRKRGTDVELLAMHTLKEAGFKFYHQFFVTHEGNAYSFDFKIKGKSILIEVDGDYWHGGPSIDKPFYKVEEVQTRDREKEQVAEAKGYTLVRVWGSELKKNTQILLDRLEEKL